jgi:hypothetical protein
VAHFQVKWTWFSVEHAARAKTRADFLQVGTAQFPQSRNRTNLCHSDDHDIARPPHNSRADPNRLLANLSAGNRPA